MGNHHSRKRVEKQDPSGFSPAVGALSRIEEVRGEAPDSYDKLIAWMVEMAENDDDALDSNTFVEHLAASVCKDKDRKTRLAAPTHQASYDSTCSSRYSKSSQSREELRTGPPTRQTSYDSNCSKLSRSPRDLLTVPRQASYDSTCSSRYSKLSRSPDDHMSVPIRQASYDSASSSRASRNSRTKEELLDPRTRFRRAMLSRQVTVDYSDDGDNVDGNFLSAGGSSGNSSFDHETEIDTVDPQAVLLSGYQETSFMKGYGKKTKKNNGQRYQGISTSVGDLLHDRVNFQNISNKKKSRSLMTMKRIMSETRPDEDIEPITEENAVASILDDSLLDRNMADILFAVESLWPKIPK